MQETFFTSKEASKITGCTLRQLQYWREKGVVVPVISDTGTGRSIYYSKTNLVELAAMVYWLSVGLSFDIACETLKTLKDQEPELFSSGTGRRFMLLSEAQERSPLGAPKISLELMEFDRTKAIASLDEGKPVIPVWLDEIYQQLQQKLKA
ncbi:Possible Transcriptional Regulator, MerR family [Trichormus variabilis ATCC 29413]|uniref:Possible Transcriptional Regulator, MerR family n=2 Tax=Anabaena variabilis TaxID=264691 RepID=Q3ME02_TRIV2|nr:MULTISPECIES: MerR family transcriptional regulator [Nostocaceae]ABA20784.1 Possible Transcriptional Regulator, MerR family [Trichormus variabilis ATCC 29413]MBC1213977.1 MerR family transcriptional regulator [Trichormus variabilis ARAD]MBC1266821.1 MerR family transcriptional regulator [Trichormus variabilis FSR]MBC1302296.1 MerR family transcriptional regulator [Trichormus variabilis N2B]MBC1310908.1 MerR family transcriptional regulator [Trichormus variabilis PNB]